MSRWEHLDFALEIGEGGRGGHPANALRSIAGEAQEEMRLLLGEQREHRPQEWRRWI